MIFCKKISGLSGKPKKGLINGPFSIWRLVSAEQAVHSQTLIQKAAYIQVFRPDDKGLVQMCQRLALVALLLERHRLQIGDFYLAA